MKRMLGTVAVLVLFTAGCGSGPTSDGNDPTVEQTSATPEATPQTTAPPADSSDLVVAPGKVGDVKAGMTKEEALATGFFDADVEGVEGCTFALQWKKQFEGVDVLTREDGSIGSLGVTKGGPQTAEGIRVGSTLADVKAAYLDLSGVKAADSTRPACSTPSATTTSASCSARRLPPRSPTPRRSRSWRSRPASCPSSCAAAAESASDQAGPTPETASSASGSVNAPA